MKIVNNGANSGVNDKNGADNVVNDKNDANRKIPRNICLSESTTNPEGRTSIPSPTVCASCGADVPAQRDFPHRLHSGRFASSVACGPCAAARLPLNDLPFGSA